MQGGSGGIVTEADPLAALKAQNLADLASAATARSNLGLAIGTNVQAYQAALASLASLGPSLVAGDVLTLAAGLPSWAAPGGGGLYTLVTTEAELITALAASDKAIAVTANITLTADRTALVSTLIKVLPGVTLACSSFELIVTAAKDLVLDLDGGATITWSRASGQPITLGAASRLFVRGGNLTNSNAAADTYFATESEEQHYQDVTLRPSNAAQTGVYCTVAGTFSGRIIGPGTAHHRSVRFSASGGTRVEVGPVLIESGTWFDDGNILEVPGLQSIVHDVYVRTITGTTLRLEITGVASNIISDEADLIIMTGTAATNIINTTGSIACQSVGTDQVITNFNANALHSTQDAKARFVSGVFQSAITFTSGRAHIFEGCVFEGNVTIDSGASCRFNQCTFLGTVTNNDASGTQIELSYDSSGNLYDTRPSMRRFNNATLDAAIESLRLYYLMNETAAPLKNTAPYGPRAPIGAIGAVTYGQTGLGGAGYGVDVDNTEYLSGMPGSIACGEGSPFTLNFGYTPDDGRPGAQNQIVYANLSSGANYEFAIEVDTSGHLLLYGPSASLLITGSGQMSNGGGVSYLISLRRYINAGTPTFELFLNGVSQGTSTTGAGALISSDAALTHGLGGAVAAIAPAIFDNESFWDSGDSALITALYNSGTIRKLVVR